MQERFLGGSVPLGHESQGMIDKRYFYRTMDIGSKI